VVANAATASIIVCFYDRKKRDIYKLAIIVSLAGFIGKLLNFG
jgi:hypothetical protein